MGLPYGWAALVQSLKGVGYESASVRYDHVLDFYGGDVLMRKLLLIIALMAPGCAVAAVVLTPAVAGYSASAGRFASAVGGFAMTAANDGFIAPSVVNVAGKAITMPATLRMAANAGTVAVSAMRFNPYLLVGTAALGWLASQNFEQQNGQWVKPSGYVLYPGDSQSGGYPYFLYGAYASWQNADCSSRGGNYSTIGSDYGCVFFGSVPAQEYSPLTEADWAALPPLPDAVKQELPYVPYMPDGVPVDSPEYAPSDVPLGDPYTKPDGSTAQPRAKISPSGDGQVTVATYDQPLTDPSGQPVSNPVPQPTPDQPPDLCQLHPESVACMSSGGPPTFVPPTDGGAPADPSIVAAGGAIDWHQHFLDESSACGLADVNYSVMNQQFTIPLSSLCQYLPILKAVVIFLASIVSIRMFALAPW